MKINSRKELQFFIQADRMINRGVFKNPLKKRVMRLFHPDYIMDYLEAMRKTSYYSGRVGVINKLLYVYNYKKYRSLGIKLGYSIGYNCFGYGLMLDHWGTIIVGDTNRIGNYAVIHTCTCIVDNGKIIGNGFYLGSGAKMTSKVEIGDNISVGANSVVNRSYKDSNAVIAGAPAHFVKSSKAWYIRDGFKYTKRYQDIEDLRKIIFDKV